MHGDGSMREAMKRNTGDKRPGYFKRECQKPRKAEHRKRRQERGGGRAKRDIEGYDVSIYCIESRAVVKNPEEEAMKVNNSRTRRKCNMVVRK